MILNKYEIFHCASHLKDVVRIQSSDELEGVGVKSYDLHSLPSAAAVISSAGFTALRFVQMVRLYRVTLVVVD